MNIFKWLKGIFFKEPKFQVEKLPISLRNFQVGDLIKLKFKDPKKLGVSSSSASGMSSRYDYTDLNTRILCGTVVGIIDFNGIMAVNFQVVKRNEHGPYTRQYVFLEDELEYVELLSSLERKN